MEQGTPTSPKSKPCFTLVDCAGHCLGDLHGAISATWLCFLFFSSLLPLKWSKACKAENIKTFWTALLVCWPFQHHLFSKQLWSWPEVVSFETLSLLLLPFVRHVDHNSLSQHWFPWSSHLLENHACVLFFLLRGRKGCSPPSFHTAVVSKDPCFRLELTRTSVITESRGRYVLTEFPLPGYLWWFSEIQQRGSRTSARCRLPSPFHF